MIYLEHLNLVVKNIPAALTFYQAAFPQWFIRSQGSREWYGKTRDWLHFGDDYQYITFNNGGENQNRDLTGHQLGLSHFAFVTCNLDQVIKRLAKAGFAVDKEGAEEPYRKNVYFIDPDGFEIEFVEYLSDDPKERNLDS
ncbi:MAG: VOC family protein [Thalassotalea sp.]|nr:VOC family protein [Thalassotalea sp.]